MKHRTAITILTLLVAILAAFAAAMGVFYDTPGQPVQFLTQHGETVTLVGHGLYAADTLNAAAQMQANDFVALVLGLPLLLGSLFFALRGSLRARLLLAGTLGFFLYTYTSMAFLAHVNPLFLIYVALMSLSLYAFILCLLTFDLNTLPQHFTPGLPRRTIAGLMFATAAFLTLAWTGRIVPFQLQGQTPPGLESYTTFVIQAMDLGFIVPLAVLAGVLLWRRSAWGYLLASVAVMKFLTMGVAVSAMGVNMALNSVPISPIELGVFPTLSVINIALAIALLRNTREQPQPIPTPSAPLPA